MPVDGGGNITRAGQEAVNGQTAFGEQVNVPISDIVNWGNMLMFLDGRKSLRGDILMNGYKASGAANATAPQDYVPLSQVQSLIASVSFIFPGFLQVDTVTSTAAPAGWLYANGQEVSRATYPQLWARVSAGNNLAATQGAKTAGQYGPGNGTTTFTLPNLYADGGYFIRPMTSGRGIGTIQQDDNKSHTHTGSVTIPPHAHNYVGPADPSALFQGQSQNSGVRSNTTRTTQSSGGGTFSLSIGNSGGTESRPKNIAYPVLIKAS